GGRRRDRPRDRKARRHLEPGHHLDGTRRGQCRPTGARLRPPFRAVGVGGGRSGAMNVTSSTPIIREIATGLRFPEGPVAMPAGSVVLVEIERRALSRVTPGGKIHVIAQLGGGPNGAAMGPGGRIYVTNNGGLKFVERPGKLFPIAQADDYTTGSIQVVDPETGKFETLYDRCDGRRLCGPNDLVFD